MDEHTEWLRQIDAESDGELTLVEQAALARHLAGCTHCSGARASHLELRVALAQSAGAPQARLAPRPVIRARTVARWAVFALLAGVVAGWGLHAGWGGPGGGALEDVRAVIVVR
jgi:anti-sigma factor RsiW